MIGCSGRQRYHHADRQAATPACGTRRARHAFLGLMETCAKLGIPFWDYLGDRLKVPDAPAVRYLPDLVRQQAASI